jgi:hypothetical protein
LLKCLLSSHPASPSIISPLTTRSGRKRKREEEEKVTTFGSLDVTMVTGWFSDVLHDFLTKKNSTVHHQFFLCYIERYPVLAWQLAGRMVVDLQSAGNRFRKVGMLFQSLPITLPSFLSSAPWVGNADSAFIS